MVLEDSSERAAHRMCDFLKSLNDTVIITPQQMSQVVMCHLFSTIELLSHCILKLAYFAAFHCFKTNVTLPCFENCGGIHLLWINMISIVKFVSKLAWICRGMELFRFLIKISCITGISESVRCLTRHSARCSGSLYTPGTFCWDVSQRRST